jgi:hypothetical protein
MQFISSFFLSGAKGNEHATPCRTCHEEWNSLAPERNPVRLELEACNRDGSREGLFSELIRSESIRLFLHVLGDQVSSACTVWPNVAGNLPAAVCGKRPARKNERSLPCRPIDACRCGSG